MELARKEFYHEHGRVMNHRMIRNFQQILGEHAIRICELTKADKKESKRGLMSSWVDIHELNKEWIGRVCYGETKTDEFTELTQKMIQSYSECVADYVLDKKDLKHMANLVEKECQFFGALTNKDVQKQTKRDWVMYTGAIVQMVNNVHRYGLESEMFYYSAAETIRCGVLLGQCLDHLLN
jgi:hypothetical protein